MTVQKPDNPFPSQGVKVNITSGKSWWQHESLMHCALRYLINSKVIEMVLHLCGLLPKTHNPGLTMRKTTDKPNWGTLPKIPDQSSSKLSRSWKKSKSEKQLQPRLAKEMRQLNVMWDPGAEEGTLGSTKNVWIEHGLHVVIVCQSWFLRWDKGIIAK